jgi:hypothetical protein
MDEDSSRLQKTFGKLVLQLTAAGQLDKKRHAAEGGADKNRHSQPFAIGTEAVA